MAMNTFWDRVEHLRKTLGLSQQQLARKINVNVRRYEGWIRRDIFPDVEYGLKISRVLEASIDFLVMGEEPALPDDDYALEGTNKIQVHTQRGVVIQEDEEPTILIPVAPQRLSAGDGEDFLPPSHYIGQIRILERMARGLDRSTLIAAQVRGDSMTGVQIFDDDVVVFAQGHLSGDGLYVVSLNGEVFVKRVEFDHLNSKVFIHSENAKYKTIETRADNENFRVLGKVVGWVHNHPY